MDILGRVCEIIADITQNPIDEITENSSAKNVEGWDTISQVNIMVTIEMDFGVLFHPEDMEGLNSVRKIMHALKAQRAAA